MEIRFGRTVNTEGGKREEGGRRSRELPVPPGLRRFARARGLELGAKDRSSISPAEARELFLLVTPMSEELRFNAFFAFDARRISPERLCYALMAGIWRDIELTYLLGTSGRATSILEGGSDPADRIARGAEAEACRAAVMIGTLLSRLENSSAALGSEVVEVDEDARNAIPWVIQSDMAAVYFAVQPGTLIPWGGTGATLRTKRTSEAIIVLPRPMPHQSDIELLAKIQAKEPESAVFLLVPQDTEMSEFPNVPWLKCPQTLDLLDQVVRGKLDTMRISRR